MNCLQFFYIYIITIEYSVMTFSTVGIKQVRGRHLATGDKRGNQFDNKSFLSPNIRLLAKFLSNKEL